jgi:pimeloyl-ACP methyl ester carboxylesterase
MVEVPGRVYYVNTAFGQVVLVARPEAFKSTKPALVMFPGVSRSPVQLAEWPARLPEADVFLAGLPGVNQVPPWKETSLTNLVQAFAGTISRNLSGRPIHLAGESLGGLIALGLGTYPWASSVTAFDPPLRTGKLWPQREAVANSIDHGRPSRASWASAGTARSWIGRTCRCSPASSAPRPSSPGPRLCGRRGRFSSRPA